MIFIFIVQFFNTAIINLLTNANIKEALGIGIFNGQYPDFDFNWYLDFGVPLITTMLINAFSPLIEFAMFYGILILFRLIDKRFKCSKYKTSTTTMQQFVNLYAGPEYLIHYKYSRVLNIVFITFMFGIVLPVLFPIALLSLIITYFAEKLSIVYYYKEPPSYDQKLNNTAIKILAWAPFLMFTFGFWMMSNKQIFNNKAELDEKANPRVETTSHVLFRDVRAGPELNLFILTWVFILAMIFHRLIIRCLKKTPLAIQVADTQDEGLPNYFDALNGENLRLMISEERYARNKLGFKTILDSTLEGIAEAQPTNKTIQGVASYDILANPRYAEKFQYFPFENNIFDELNEEGDKVKVCLNLAYMKEKDLKFVNLNKRFRDTLRVTSKNKENISKY